MLNFTELKTHAANDIVNALGSDWTYRETPVAKANRGVLTGLTFMQEGASGGPTIYAEDIYEWTQDAPYDTVIEEIIENIRESVKMHAGTEDFFNNLTFDKARDMLTVRIVDKSLNRDLLENRIYKDCSGGLALIADIEFGLGRCSINEDLLKQLEVDKDELFEAALESAAKNHPASLTDIADRLFRDPENLLNEPASELGKNTLYVLTNNEGFMGASAIMYPGLMEQLHDMLDGDFYVLPSSMHEVLITRLSEWKDPKGLHDTILSANGNGDVVAKEDILSNHLFLCDGKELKVVF